jgi:hypothetical protein
VRSVAVALVALCCAFGVAVADDKPWAAGVTAENQAAALELYRQGNELFEQSRYLEAVETYQRALASWDHPSIRYNAAVCLINLGRPEEAYENLVAALRFGGAPLSDELQRQAATYEKLLAGQLAELEVRCKDDGAKVMLDGKELLACPGTETKKLRPGRHQVVGEKPGYETDARALELAAGKKTVVILELRLVSAKGRLERRWPRWLPYSVLGAGVVIGAIAVPLSLEARDDYRAWDAQFVALCPSGCDPSTLEPSQRAMLDELDDERKRSRAIAYTSIAVGAAAITAGFALVLLNQPRLVAAAPEVSANRATLSLVGRF